MTGPDASAALCATGLGLRYRRYRRRGEWALRDCEFTVPRGRVTALVGRNGAGKSTLLHLAGGLLRPDAGELRVLGTVPGTAGSRARVALLTQDKPLYPRLTVAWWRPAADRSYGLFWYDDAALSGSGPRVVAAALFGLAAGTLLGLLTRRVPAAMGLTLLATGATTLLLEWTHHTRLPVPPQTYVSAGSVPKAPMGEKWSTGTYGLITASGRHDDVLNCPCPSGAQLRECMAAHGYVARFYEASPAGDHWAFQWTDTAVLGGLAVLLTAATVLLLRRRV
ncbi:ATP-binding cassette domain-containing protein [Streptomyces sp. NPDC127079]|uniref:ATP-binding cassette domain-containing protein n=1 Tax=Streptomyces sp. NPDC127079 TaxID=3347132 RepID=UPI003653452F